MSEAGLSADGGLMSEDDAEGGATSCKGGGKRRRRIRTERQQVLNRLAQQRYRCASWRVATFHWEMSQRRGVIITSCHAMCFARLLRESPYGLIHA